MFARDPTIGYPSVHCILGPWLLLVIIYIKDVYIFTKYAHTHWTTDPRPMFADDEAKIARSFPRSQEEAT